MAQEWPIMEQDSHLLLSSRFYAYAKGGRPWGLPNHIWAEAPHMLIFFDQLLCDEEAYKAEELASRELGWVASSLFVRLKTAGILVTASMADIVRTAPPPRPRLQLPAREVHYATYVQQQLGGLPIFDWDGKIAKRANTLAPSTQAAPTRSLKSSLKLTYLWNIIAAPYQVVPPLETLIGQAGEAYRRALEYQRPHWQRLERLEVGIEEYTLNLTQFKPLYKIIDEPLRPIAEQKLEELLRFRERTKEARSLLRPLVRGALDDNKELLAYVTRVQAELAKTIPSMFPAGAKAAGKCLIGMAIAASPWVAEYFGYTLPGEAKLTPLSGLPFGISAYRNIQQRIEERISANPLRFMKKMARRYNLSKG
jgi:hypothetical protein